MAKLKNPRKWSKARRSAFERRQREAKPLKAHYVGETTQPAVDVRSIEERAFRRGMFAAFQSLVEVMFIELR